MTADKHNAVWAETVRRDLRSTTAPFFRLCAGGAERHTLYLRQVHPRTWNASVRHAKCRHETNLRGRTRVQIATRTRFRFGGTSRYKTMGTRHRHRCRAGGDSENTRRMGERGGNPPNNWLPPTILVFCLFGRVSNSQEVEFSQAASSGPDGRKRKTREEADTEYDEDASSSTPAAETSTSGMDSPTLSVASLRLMKGAGEPSSRRELN